MGRRFFRLDSGHSGTSQWKATALYSPSVWWSLHFGTRWETEANTHCVWCGSSLLLGGCSKHFGGQWSQCWEEDWAVAQDVMRTQNVWSVQSTVMTGLPSEVFGQQACFGTQHLESCCCCSKTQADDLSALDGEAHLIDAHASSQTHVD